MTSGDTQYKVTIAIPVYNVADCVEQSILSALDQTFESIEFLVIDDKGTDNSMEIVRNVMAAHPRSKNIRMVAHEKNMGLAAARNTGIDHATGEYLYFLDSDDTIPADCIDILYRKMMEHPVDFVVGSHQSVNPEGKVVESGICADMLIEGKFNTARLFFKQQVQRKWPFPIFACNKLYRRSFLMDNHIRCFPGYVHEDNPFNFDAITKAASCSMVSAITYCYLIRPGSIMNQKAPYHKIDSVFFLLRYEKERSRAYAGEDFYNDLLTATMDKTWLHIAMYIRFLDRKKDRQRIKDILRYPADFSTVVRLKHHQLFNCVVYLIGRMPYPLQWQALRLRHYILMR